MSDDAQRGPRPDETPTPPTTTRWSEREGRESETLLPPFLPRHDRATGGAAAEPASTVEPEPVVEPEPAVEAEPVEAEPAGAIESASDEFPFEAFDLEAEHIAPESAGVGAAAVAPAEISSQASPTETLASRLESLAARLRTEGAAAAESDMASSDRMTSLLGAVLAGYLAASRE